MRPIPEIGPSQNHRDDGSFQAGRALDRKIDRAWSLRLDPIAEAAQRAVGSNHCVDAGAEGVKGGVTSSALHDRLDLGPVLIVVAQRRQRDLWLPRLAITKDQ